MTYFDLGTGVWNPSKEATFEIIHVNLFDEDENVVKSVVEFIREVTGDCEVTSVTTSANVPLNNPEEEIKDAIRGKYGRVTISYSTL